MDCNWQRTSSGFRFFTYQSIVLMMPSRHGTRGSQLRQLYSYLAMLRSSTMGTMAPRDTSAYARLEPMEEVLPVTRTCLPFQFMYPRLLQQVILARTSEVGVDK